MATVSFRIEDDLKARLDGIVEDHGLNVSNFFRQALVEKLATIELRGEREIPFSLTIKERVSLVLQLRTLAAVEDDENTKRHLQTQIEALTDGYELHYSDLIREFDNGLSRRACLEVGSILDMYADLLWGFDGLKDKAGIEEVDIAFPGFDGNYETRYMGYCRYYLFKLGNYQSLHEQAKRNDCNSHCPMLTTYRAMLEIFLPIKRQHPPTRLTAGSIKRILAARR